MPKYECANCEWTGSQEELKDIRHWHERVDVDHDTVFPDGECPLCGALAYEAEPEPAAA